MTIFKKELRQGKNTLLIWSLLMAFMLGVCILIYPQAKAQMEVLADGFTQMGDFSAAFGMDRLNLAKFQDYFGMEWSNVMGLLGTMFAALLGIHGLSGEEGGHTAEFLLTHPVTRCQVVWEKLLALTAQITVFNLCADLISLGMTAAIGETIEGSKAGLLFGSTWLMHLEIACICFGVSSLLRRNHFALGIGIGAAAYFLNILSNLQEELEFLKYLSPMGYCDSAVIFSEGTLNTAYMLSGLLILVLFSGLAFRQYSRKDIA